MVFAYQFLQSSVLNEKEVEVSDLSKKSVISHKSVLLRLSAVGNLEFSFWMPYSIYRMM